ncbi:MAG: glycosyltransferase family 2 protein [Candidatus Bathyarchaeota archaeon]|nr:glycosyltransferase family 2 protein [Candidatus Bathyarchaeota archaeon]
MAKQSSNSVNLNSASQPKVVIIILNWNGWKNTIECLESLYQIDYPKYTIILVDNGSKDGSIQQIRNYAEGKSKVESTFFEYDPTNKPIKLFKQPENVTFDFNKELVLIENPMNYGFATGTNIALKYAQKQHTDYALLLNNDIVVDKHFLSRLILEAEKNPEIGIAGPTLYQYKRPATVDFAGENLTLWRVKGKEYTTTSTRPREVDKIEGSCMLIKRVVLDKVGLLYTKFWTYWEETDLCFRAKKAGYRVVYVPESMVWHKVAQSIGGEGNLRREYYLNRNRLLFARRNLSWNNQAKFLVYFFGFELWLKVAVELKHHTLAGAFMWLRASFDGLRMYLDPRNAP